MLPLSVATPLPTIGFKPAPVCVPSTLTSSPSLLRRSVLRLGKSSLLLPLHPTRTADASPTKVSVSHALRVQRFMIEPPIVALSRAAAQRTLFLIPNRKLAEVESFACRDLDALAVEALLAGLDLVNPANLVPHENA